MPDLSGSVVLVTGAASGIGAACARQLVGDGARVVLLDIDRAGGERVAAGLPADAAMFQPLDVSSQDQWQAAFGVAKERFGAVTGLVNCAATAAEADVLDEVDDALWRRILDVNLTGTMLGCQGFLQHVDRRKGGAIVNFASIQGDVGVGDALAYAASKGGVRMLTRSIAQHCMAQRIPVRCNAVSPGYIDTPMIAVMFAENSVEEDRARLAGRHPIGRLGQPIDLARAVAFLLSGDAAFVNGSDYKIDGGYTAI